MTGHVPILKEYLPPKNNWMVEPMDFSITPSCTARGVVMCPNVNIQHAIDNEYENVREIDGVVYGIRRFMYTVGVCGGIDETGYSGRFCFSSHMNATLFLMNWDGHTLPVIGEDGCTAIK